jgi:hypothetical protein
MDIPETQNGVIAKKAQVLGNPAYRGTEAKMRRMLKHYIQNGRLLQACEAAGINHSVHYRRMQSDPVYRAAVEEAEQAAAQRLEDKVYQWAEEGELQAAVILLKRFRPELYRERASIDVTANISISDMLTEARARVIAIEPNDRTGTEG